MKMQTLAKNSSCEDQYYNINPSIILFKIDQFLGMSL